MIFDKSADALLFLKDKSLELYQPEPKTPPVKLDLPPKIFSNLEILDQEKFTVLISEWLEKNKLEKHKAVIVLSEPILFSKAFPITDVETLTLEAKAFLEEVPFEPKKVVSTVLQSNQEVMVIATGSDLFLGVKNVLENLQWDIVGVAPLFVFGDFGKSGELSTEEVNQILTSENTLGKCNFLDPKDMAGVSKAPIKNQNILKIDSDQGKKKFFSKEFIVVMLLVVLLAGIWAGAFYTGLVKIPWNAPSKSEQIVQKSIFKDSADSTKSADLKIEVDKKDLTIQVLNGTGIAGQAGKIKDILTKMGFGNIEVGNAESLDNTATEASFSHRVSQAIQQEIVTELSKTFEKVASQSAAINDKFDIQITSGSYLNK